MTTTNTGIGEHGNEWNATATDYPRTSTVHRLFEEQAHSRPEAPAVDDGGTALTYEQLDAAANVSAQRLVAAGVRPGELVGVLVESSTEAVVAILGVLKTGAAYVPLDPDYPDARLSEMCDRVDIRVIVSRPSQRYRLGAGRGWVSAEVDPRSEVSPPDVSTAATDLAYVIFTSGSSGRPKAVAVPHRGPIRLVRGTGYIAIGPGDTVLSTANLSFDLSCFEFFGALLNGARVVCLDKETLLSPHALVERIETERATVMWLSAGVFHEVAGRRPDMFSRLNYLVAGGDALNPNVVRAVLAHRPPRHFLNGYGPTENAVLSTVHEIESLDENAETVPIGRPIANSTAYVLRDDLGLAEPGEEGELCVGGDGVADGYHGDPELTRERFVPDPFSDVPGARLYRTGDRARWRDDGVIEFLGRDDRQVKIRGFRVELGEIEHTLSTHLDVSESVVDLREHRSGDRCVVAWVVPSGSARGHLADRMTAAAFEQRLRRHVRDRLPLFMVPTAVRAVDGLPLNHSGKVDRSRLPEPDDVRAEISTPPLGETERIVASIWCDLLGLPSVDREDDFFELGGQSLQVTQVVAALEDQLGVPASLGRFLIRRLLSASSVREYARSIDAAVRDDDSGESDGVKIDFWSEARLDPEPRWDAPLVENWDDPGEVLLTGSTGFLGAFLVDRLVRRTRATVLCLARGRDEDEALSRIAANMRRYGLSFDDVRDRVVPVVGDLSLPSLGLGDRFDELADRVDVVLHNGSHVNFVYPYSSLSDVNVDGSREVIRLAAARRRKPVHYVSTIATIVGCGPAGRRHVPEDTPPGHPENISMGYPETKWVAERLFLQASARGLPVSIYRPYEVTGTTAEGIWNTDTMMCALFATIAETGVAPDVALPLDFVPVDVTAEALVHLVTHEPPRGHIYNATSPQDARLGLLVDRLRARGYPVCQVTYDQWVREMSAHTSANPDASLAPFMPIFAGAANSGSSSVKEMYFAEVFPTFGRENFERALAGSGLRLPPVDADMLDLYLNQFEKSGFLTRVAATVREEEPCG